MPTFGKSKGFKLKSGNKPSFKMMGASPVKQTKDIIGEDTYSAEKNKNQDQLELGLSTTGGSSQPGYTNERLIVTPDDNLLDNRGNKLSEGGFIEVKRR